VEISVKKRSHVRHSCRIGDNIKADIEEIIRKKKETDWIYLTQTRI
jgi:hypothetical protein